MGFCSGTSVMCPSWDFDPAVTGCVQKRCSLTVCNVLQMIENQEELRASQETIRTLQDEINMLKSQKAELEERPPSGSEPEGAPRAEELQNQAGPDKKQTEQNDSFHRFVTSHPARIRHDRVSVPS